jgi:hypothetical protein
VKEFLTSDYLWTSEVINLCDYHIPFDAAHTILTRACLTVLLQLENIKRRASGGFLWYCMLLSTGSLMPSTRAWYRKSKTPWNSYSTQVVSNRGNPRVFFLYPYPTPPNTLPLREGKGYPSDE